MGVYSTLLLESDNRTNMAVFMRPEMNLTAADCGRDRTGICNTTIDGVITDKRYVFNVVVESKRGFKMAYAGLIMKTDWEVGRKGASDKTLAVVGAVAGSVLGMTVIIYILLLKIYA